MRLFSYSPSLGNWHLTAEKRSRPRPVPSCRLWGEMEKLYLTLLKALGTKKILLNGALSCCWCVGTPEGFQSPLPAVKQIKGSKSETTEQIHEKPPTTLCHLQVPNDRWARLGCRCVFPACGCDRDPVPAIPPWAWAKNGSRARLPGPGAIRPAPSGSKAGPHICWLRGK